VAFSADGLALATASWDTTVKLWDLTTGHEARTFHGHAESVRSVAFAPGDQMLASGSWDGTAKLWAADTGLELATFKGHGEKVHAVAFAQAAPADLGQESDAPGAPGVDDGSGVWSPINVG
jgi:WD40 repeat protein